MALGDQVREHSKEWEYDQSYDPACLAPARNIMTPEQVHEYCDEQPERHDEHEYCNGIDQEVTEREAFVEPQHRDPPCVWRTVGLW